MRSSTICSFVAIKATEPLSVGGQKRWDPLSGEVSQQELELSLTPREQLRSGQHIVRKFVAHHSRGPVHLGLGHKQWDSLPTEVDN